MFEAIFWDNDGVLMETEHLYYQANAEALAREGVELTLAMFRDISLCRGESVLDLGRGSGCDETALRGWRDRRYRQLLHEEASVAEGVEEVLKELHGRLPMAIVTSCRRENFLEMHRRSGLLGYFDFILTREDYNNGKPHPEPYLTACRRAGLPAAACLVVEDSERGYRSGLAAGMTVAAIPGTLNADGDFAGARWRIESVRELPSLLGLSRSGSAP